MNKQDFEDILTDPQDLTQDNLKLLLEYSRKEKSSVEYKQEFDREPNGKVKLLDFCKVVIGFMNSESTGSVVIYGIDNAIDSSTNEDVSTYIVGHIISGTRKEDLIGYIRGRVWPADVWMIHIKQLPISADKAVTTIYIGKMKSKPYLYYHPNNREEGIRSFQRSSGVTYELEAPQLHQFIKQTSESQTNELKENEDLGKLNLTRRDKILKENYDDIIKSFKDPQQFGFYTICVMPAKSLVVTDDEIVNLLNPTERRKVKVMEELWYTRGLTLSQKWYRRILVPDVLAEENKCVWAITCYRKTGILIVNSLIDDYLKGKVHLHPFHFSYEIQRTLQMAKALYQTKTNSLMLTIDFKYIETSGYTSYIYGSIEKIHPYVGFYEPIEKEIKSDNIYSDSKSDVLIPDVNDCMKEVAKIFGLLELPDSLTDPNGDMFFVQRFKGIR
jgi:hypothetical protein